MKVSIYYAFFSLVKCKMFKRDSLKKIFLKRAIHIIARIIFTLIQFEWKR